MMELVGQCRRPPGFIIPFPWITRLAFSTLIIISIMIIATIMAATTHPKIPDPFSGYDELFGENALQAALADGFICQPAGVISSLPPVTDYCIQNRADGYFSEVFMWMSGHTMDEINFSVRGDSLNLGDLVVLWGQPETWLYCETVVSAWPARRITSIVTPRRDSYFSPIRSVSFARSGSSRLGRLLTNDMLHGCGHITKGSTPAHFGLDMRAWLS